MTTRKPRPLIRCATCGQMREPVVFRAIFCKPCWDELEAKLKADPPPLPAGVPLFGRNDGRLFD